MLAQAVPVPELGELPSLGERKGSASWPFPLLAPAINVLFRPEQKHGASGEGDILVPFAGRYGDVDDPASGDEFPLRISTGMARLQHPQDASMRASLPSMAGIPSASQMQLPNQERSPMVTGKGVGMAENGATRQSSPFSCCMKA